MSAPIHHRDDQANAHAPTVSSPTTAPGRAPATARIAGRPQIVFRVASVEAATALAGALGPRDDNGVAAGADTLIQRAAESTGSALPADVRGRFETSLGADLSAVRVHTGPASAAAAAAVGAKAYTVGNDIHFSAGRYAPTDPFGIHLLAHEVAHTQQQAGAAPTRQDKLEVSTPGDAAEVEADHAASAMVAGQNFAIAGSVSPQVSREPEGECREDAPAPEEPAPDEAEQPAPDGCTPDEVNWDAMATPTSAMITTVWTGTPVYAMDEQPPTDQTPATDDGQYVGAFNASFSQAVASWNALQAFSDTYRSQELALGGIDPSGPMKAEIQAKRVDSGFGADDKLAANFDLGGDKVTAADRLALKPLKDATAAADAKVTNGGRTLKQIAYSITQQQNTSSSALNAWRTAALAEEKNQNTARQLELNREFAQINADVDEAMAGAGALYSIVGTLIDPTKAMDAVKGVVTATEKLAKANAVTNYNSRTAAIAGAITAADSKINALAQDTANNSHANCLIEIKKLVLEADKVSTQIDVDVAARDTAYAAYGNKVKEIAMSSGSLNEADATKVATAIEATPAIERVIGTCNLILSSTTSPAYSAESGRGAALATQSSVAELVSHVSVLKGYKPLIEDHKAHWERRLASVKAAY